MKRNIQRNVIHILWIVMLVIQVIIFSKAPNIKAEKITLNRTNAVLMKGKKLKLKLNKTVDNIKWKSSRTSIASVNKNGTVSAKKVGTVKITATIGKSTYTCNIVVQTPSKYRENNKEATLSKVKEVKKKLGSVKSKEFLTSDKSDISPFPKTAYGFINYCRLDVDNDGILELLIVTSEKSVMAYLYKFDGKKMKLTSKEAITTIGAFNEIKANVFYNKKLKQYSILIVSESIGSYTGIWGLESQLYQIGKKIELVANWEWNNGFQEWEDLDEIEKDIMEKGIGYIEISRVSIGNKNDKSQDEYVLFKTNTSIKDGDMPSQFVNYLSILSSSDLYKINKTNTLKRR